MTAKSRADAENKVLLVSFGAEWCIWCHVFYAYVSGGVDKFTYTYGHPEYGKARTATLYERSKSDNLRDAAELSKFVSESFVLVHIEAEYSPNGGEVVSLTEAWDHYENEIPYIYSVDGDGKFVAAFSHNAAENRRDTDDWYRGYHRPNLLEQLKSMHDQAIQ